jgi:hypothetical protein
MSAGLERLPAWTPMSGELALDISEIRDNVHPIWPTLRADNHLDAQ